MFSFKSGWSRLARPFRRRCLLVPLNDHSALPGHGLFDRQTTQARLSTTKLPQPRVYLIHIAATPAICCCSVTGAPKEARPLVLAVLVTRCEEW